MIFFIILTIWITITVLVIGLCLAARLGDLQLAARHALRRDPQQSSPYADAGSWRSRQGCSRPSRAMLLERALRSRRAAPPGSV